MGIETPTPHLPEGVGDRMPRAVEFSCFASNVDAPVFVTGKSAINQSHWGTHLYFGTYSIIDLVFSKIFS